MAHPVTEKTPTTTVDGLRLLVFGLPHLSRYTIESRLSVLNWIKERIGEHNNRPIVANAPKG